MIVHHYFPAETDNIGDQLVAVAIRRAICRHFGSAEFVDIPVNDFSPPSMAPIGLVNENVDRSNAEADLVIVGGSNLLEPRPRSGQAGRQHWGVLTDLVSIHRLTCPLLLMGLGTGSGFGRPMRRWSPSACEEIRLLHTHAFASAVRDQITANRLATIGVKTAATGCPVTFITDRPVRSTDASLPLLVSLPPSRILKSFIGRRFMASTIKYVDGLARAGVPVVLTLHAASDLATTRSWIPSNIEVFYTCDVDRLIARYEASRGVVGFRLHAALLGLGLGKPVIPVGLDWRGSGFIQTFELEQYSIRSHSVGQFHKLRQLTERLLANDGRLILALDRAKSRFQARFESFLSQAASRFNSSRQEDKLPCLAADERMFQVHQPGHGGQNRAA